MATRQEAREARDAKLEELHERLTAAVDQLVSGEDWKRALEFAARFRARSFRNTLLIFSQHLDAFDAGRVPDPEPSYVAGYKQWQTLGRQVERGQPGYMIFAPVTGRFASSSPADPESWRRLGRFEKPKPGEVVRSRMVGAKPAYVWDASQTSGDAVPERPAPTLLEGQAPAGLWEGLAALVEAEGFTVLRVEHEGMASRSARMAGQGSQLGGQRTAWAHAALRLRTAADLVATHFGPLGTPRTPEAASTTAATFDAGLADLGRLAQAVLAQEAPLALRALQAGVPRGVLDRQLPGLNHLADLARHLASDTPRPVGTSLDALAQLPLRRRLDDPATELTDTMIRLRQSTWELAGDRGDALASLRTMAALGVAVHAHTAAFHGADLTAPEPAGADRGAGALVRHARTWQRLHHSLSEFAILAPPTTSVHDDAVASARLLRALAPIEHHQVRASVAPADRHVAAVLNGAVQVMADIAVHEGTTFDRLARAGLLYMPARTLPRELVSDRPDLATARLEQRLVRAPDVTTGATARLYTEVASHPIGVSTAAPVGRLPAASMDTPAIFVAK